MTFELKFNSAEADYSLQVTYIALLERSRVPFTYLISPESTITTNDEAAVTHITKALGSSPLNALNETRYAVLVEANRSRWILYGRKQPDKDVMEHGCQTQGRIGEAIEADERGPDEEKEIEMRMVVKARMVGGNVLANLVRPQVQPGECVFLVKKRRNALDDHQVKNKRRKKVSSPAEPQVSSRDFTSAPLGRQAPTVSSATLDDGSEQPRASSLERESATKVQRTVAAKHSLDTTTTATSALDQVSSLPAISNVTMQSVTVERALKDKLKKMIVTLLSLKGISKKSPVFKDLYGHTLQASTFALRHTPTADMVAWEASAMSVNQTLLRMFLGAEHRDTSS